MVRVPVLCEGCGVTFPKEPSAIRGKIFCSKPCYAAWRRANIEWCRASLGARTGKSGASNPMFKHGRTAKREKFCLRCGAKFLGKEHSECCSRTCSAKLNKGKILAGPHRDKLLAFMEGPRSGPDNHNWRGGRSYFPYTIGWNRTLSKSIRDRDGNACVTCRSTKWLVVHHRDLEKTNHDPSNLITMCQTCHVRLHHNKLCLLP